MCICCMLWCVFVLHCVLRWLYCVHCALLVLCVCCACCAVCLEILMLSPAESEIGRGVCRGMCRCGFSVLFPPSILLTAIHWGPSLAIAARQHRAATGAAERRSGCHRYDREGTWSHFVWVTFLVLFAVKEDDTALVHHCARFQMHMWPYFARAHALHFACPGHLRDESADSMSLSGVPWCFLHVL